MVPLVLALGIVATLVGVATIGFGIPIEKFSLGNTLIIAGATVMSAGLVILALAAVLRALDQARLALAGSAEAEPRLEASRRERSQAKPAEVEPVEAGWSRPAPGPPPRVERDQPARAPAQARAERAPRETSADPPWLAASRERFYDEPEPDELPDIEPARDAEAMAEMPPPPQKRRLFGWTRRSRARREEMESDSEQRFEPELDENAYVEDSRPSFRDEDRQTPRRPARPAAPASPAPMEWPAQRYAQEDRQAPAPMERPAQRYAQGDPQAGVDVLKSGTIDGMAYTLYTDGSIDAEFPEGRIRFASIEDLRQHLEMQDQDRR